MYRYWYRMKDAVIHGYPSHCHGSTNTAQIKGKGPFHEPTNQAEKRQLTADKCVSTKKDRSAGPI